MELENKNKKNYWKRIFPFYIRNFVTSFLIGKFRYLSSENCVHNSVFSWVQKVLTICAYAKRMKIYAWNL